MSSNKSTPSTPGRVRALTQQWERKVTGNKVTGNKVTGNKVTGVQATLSLLDVLPDPNCRLAPQKLQLNAATVARTILDALPDSNCSLVPQKLQADTAIVKTDPRGVFHRFGDLPIEIRFMIWELTLPGPRSHIIKSNSMVTRVKTRRIPMALKVNFESRDFALKKLTLLFGGTNLIGSENCHALYFNPKLDTLCLFAHRNTFHFLMGPCYNQTRLDFDAITWQYGHRAIQQPEPIRECDMVTSLEFPKVRRQRLVDTAYFRNLKKLTIRYSSYLLDYTSQLEDPLERARVNVDFLIEQGQRVYQVFKRESNWG
ncbi:hypothetical protein NHQ30_002226 [Ciborinia camelliae]|nr:hypothetical protein NHQ30_002226 [Ciborinia camelliae]